MIVSHKHKFIFVKTRKTAGTSIEIALSQYLAQEDIITPISDEDEAIREELGWRGPQNDRVPFARYTPRDWARQLVKGKQTLYYNHMPASSIRRYLGRKVWHTYHKFCFERNPWDKAVSLYYWRTRDIHPRPSLLEFLRSVQSQLLSNYHMYSLRGQLAVDYVARYEDLGDETNRIWQTLGLAGDVQLPHAKSSVREDRRHYTEIMGQKEIELVNRVCAQEIALLGYTF